jgi:hypothetical protein
MRVLLAAAIMRSMEGSLLVPATRTADLEGTADTAAVTQAILDGLDQR